MFFKITKYASVFCLLMASACAHLHQPEQISQAEQALVVELVEKMQSGTKAEKELASKVLLRYEDRPEILARALELVAQSRQPSIEELVQKILNNSAEESFAARKALSERSKEALPVLLTLLKKEQQELSVERENSARFRLKRELLEKKLEDNKKLEAREKLKPRLAALSRKAKIKRSRAAANIAKNKTATRKQVKSENLDIPELIDRLASRSRAVRMRVTDRLVAKGAEAVPHLIDATSHQDERVRVWSVTALGRIAAPEAKDALNNALEDDSATVRARARKSLKQIAGQS